MNTILDFWLTSPILVIIVTLTLIVYNLRLLSKSYRLRKQGHSTHFIQPFLLMSQTKAKLLEENGSIFSKTWIIQSLSIILLTGLGSFLMTSHWNNYNSLIGAGSELLIGVIVGHQVQRMFSHFQNIGLFRIINNYPSEIKGKIILKKPYLFLNFRVNLLEGFLLWSVIFLIGRRVFFLGGMISILLVFLVSFLWERNLSPESSTNA